MEQLNSSIKEGGLTCSFNDFQLSEYIQQKRRKAGRIPVKHAVEKVGPQSDGSWVLSPSVHINTDGELIDADHSQVYLDWAPLPWPWDCTRGHSMLCCFASIDRTTDAHAAVVAAKHAAQFHSITAGRGEFCDGPTLQNHCEPVSLLPSPTGIWTKLRDWKNNCSAVRSCYAKCTSFSVLFKSNI